MDDPVLHRTMFLKCVTTIPKGSRSKQTEMEKYLFETKI